MLFNVVLDICIVLSMTIAFRWGGREEKLAAAAMLVAIVASNFAISGRYHHTEIGLFAVDFALFAGLLLLALRSDRYWPMWAAAFQLVATMVHFGSLVETGNFAWAYYAALIFWSFPVFIALGAGSWLEGRYRDA